MERVTTIAPKRSAAGEHEIVMEIGDSGVRAVNQFLHTDVVEQGVRSVRIEQPDGAHNIAAGVDAEIDITIMGHTGYYVGGMNKRANITVHGNAERGAAENMMSGTVRIKGNASECAGATAHGGLLVIEGDAAGRCGISLKGGDIVVGGNIGHASAFMAQAGRIVVCGDAGIGLGDSLYEAVIYVRGRIEGLGADARVEPMTAADHATVKDLLSRAGIDPAGSGAVGELKRIASARTLYHWNSSNHAAY